MLQCIKHHFFLNLRLLTLYHIIRQQRQTSVTYYWSTILMSMKFGTKGTSTWTTFNWLSFVSLYSILRTHQLPLLLTP
jgi:hypothetical protein